MTDGSITGATALQVLVVDDSPAQRTRVRSSLERAGLTVVGEAEDGARALTQAAVHHPDVVLMDLRMPGMDGVQATRLLRRQQPDMPVVLWTRDDAQLDWAVGTSGAHAGISKGIDTMELVATLRGACAAEEEGRTVADGRPGSPADASAEGLTAAEWAALKQLEETHGYAMRWPVGRQVTRSLANRRLVVVAPDYVLLTQAGRRALASNIQHGSRSVLPDPDRTDVGATTGSRGPGRGWRGLHLAPASGKGKWNLAAVAFRFPRTLRS
jgi:CheY-like chemotaxis protein